MMSTPDCGALGLFHNFLENLKTNFDSNNITINNGTDVLELNMIIIFRGRSSYNDSLERCSLNKFVKPTGVVKSTGGGRSRRKSKYKSNTTHNRKTHRKYARKTHRKHARKTRDKRTHRSRTPRKHKKYSRKH